MLETVQILPPTPYETRRGRVIAIGGTELSDEQLTILFEESKSCYLMAQICTAIGGPQEIVEYYNSVYLGYVDSLENLKRFLNKAQHELSMGRSWIAVRYWSEFKVIFLK